MTPPAAFVTRGPIPSQAECYYGPDQYAQVKILYAWAPENSLKAKSAMEDYTGQNADYAIPAPPPPPQTEVEQAIETELAKPENADLRQWINFQLGSPGESDPTGIHPDSRPDIEFPDWKEHWELHRHHFSPEHPDADEYWRDAVEVIRRANDEWSGYEKCPSDGGTLFWDDDRQVIVIVRNGRS